MLQTAHSLSTFLRRVFLGVITTVSFAFRLYQILGRCLGSAGDTRINFLGFLEQISISPYLTPKISSTLIDSGIAKRLPSALLT